MEVNAPASGKGSGWKGPGWKGHQVELSTLTIRVDKKKTRKKPVRVEKKPVRVKKKSTKAEKKPLRVEKKLVHIKGGKETIRVKKKPSPPRLWRR